MVHEWVKNGNRVSIEYVDGVKEFLNVARQTLNANGLTLCPCANCLNLRLQKISVIAAHLIDVGIDPSYTRWVHHGEEEVIEEDVGHDDFNEEPVDLRAGLEDVIGNPVFKSRPILKHSAVGKKEMMKLRNENSVESMSDKSIIEKVLERNSVRLHGWGRDPNTASKTMSTTQNPKHPSYGELVDALETLKGKCAIMEQTLIERNIMPPPSTSRASQGDTSGASQGDTSESGENSG